MKPDGWSPLEELVRNANPVVQPCDLVDSDAAAAVTLLIEQRRQTMTTAPTIKPPQTTPPPTPPHHRAWAFAAAFIVVIVLGGAIALFGGSDDSQVADEVVASTTLIGDATTTSVDDATATTLGLFVDQPLTASAAIEIADANIAAWNADDSQGVADLYTEDGLMNETELVGYSGREQIAARMESVTLRLANAKRTGDVTIVSDNTFTFPSQYDYDDETIAGIQQFEVRGTLIARSDWLYSQEVPTEVVDAYFAAWNAADAGAVGALYAAQSGIHIDPQVGILRGRDQIEADVARRGPGTTDARRTGELTLSDQYTFVFPARFDRDGATWAGVMEIDVRSSIVFRTEWLGWSRVD